MFQFSYEPMKSFPYIKRRTQTAVAGLLLVVLSIAPIGCFTDESYQPYYGRVVVRSQEFRWRDGGLPQTFDPAFAAAPPDTDLVRAIFEGLTDYDPRTLAPIPGVATRWESSDGGRLDFLFPRRCSLVQRRVRDREGFCSFLAAHDQDRRARPAHGAAQQHPGSRDNLQMLSRQLPSEEVPTRIRIRSAAVNPNPVQNLIRTQSGPTQAGLALRLFPIGLRVRLRPPDMNFPALVAHPVFRPVKLKDEDTTQRIGRQLLVSNGAFSLRKTGPSECFWSELRQLLGQGRGNTREVEFVGQRTPNLRWRLIAPATLMQ